MKDAVLSGINMDPKQINKMKFSKLKILDITCVVVHTAYDVIGFNFIYQCSNCRFDFNVTPETIVLLTT